MGEAKWSEAGCRLKEYRAKLAGKPSIFKVAKSLNISGNYLSEIERGLKVPSDAVLQSIAEYYCINKTELFALYNKVIPEGKDFILANPPFRKTMTHISTDDRLTEDEKEYLSGELYKIYEELLKKKEKKKE